MELEVLNIEGKSTGRKITLHKEVFGIKPNDHAIYLDVKQYMANRRQGTHKTKGRSEVAGSTRKLGRQKGSGGARPGDIKSPVRVGGGRIFGPVPRSYRFKLNKKVKLLARKSALTYKAQKDAICVVENLNFDAPKTKNFVALTRNLNVEGKKTLLVLPAQNSNVYLSARNVPRVNVTTVTDLNTYTIMNAQTLVIAEDAVAIFEKHFKA
ncbi:MAG: 50S ribosomal protein L4 [Prevotellaceae bacterium]|jgi:large subunit ribosomal protein L4|nr:50S ribosomal protein L4 [Prevotellaceae bacterium]